MEQRLVFDRVAALYDRARPGYPPALIEDVVRLSGIPERGRILEVGCGSGQATVAFAERGYRLTCLEPGAALARLAERKLAPYGGVEIQRLLFEDWKPGAEGFHLVVSAQAFHWVDPEVRMRRAAESLRDSGWLALFWNTPLPGETPLDREIQEHYRRGAPGLFARVPGLRPAAGGDSIEDEIAASGGFGDVVARQYPWERRYTSAQYVDLMRTQSDHLLLPEDARERLLESVRGAIDRHGGGHAVRYVARLFAAPRAPR